ncbi:MAG: Crp/Fnr family transcriptional regulator [Peptococcaceae bacterium]
MEAKKFLCLRDLPIFSDLDEESFKFVCLAAAKNEIKRGTALFNQGDIVDSIYLVKEGRFKMVQVTPDGHEVILQIFGQGEAIGEAALFQDKYQPAAAIALEDSKICAVGRPILEKIIKDKPEIAIKIICNLGSYLYRTWEHISELNTQTTQEKVLGLLIRLSQEYGESCAEGTRIKIRLTQQDIASMIGSSRVMVVQSLKELMAQNYLRRENRFYILKYKCF